MSPARSRLPARIKVNGSWTFKVSGGSIYFIDDDKKSTGKVTSSDAESLPEVIYDKEYTL